MVSSRLFSTCPDQNFKKKNLKLCQKNFFLNLSEQFSGLDQFFSLRQGLQNCFLRVHRNILPKNSLNVFCKPTIFHWFWWNKVSDFDRSLSDRASNTVFYVSRGTVREKSIYELFCILAEIFGHKCQNCVLHVPKIVFKKCFLKNI